MKTKTQEEVNLDKIKAQFYLPYSGGIPSAPVLPQRGLQN